MRRKFIRTIYGAALVPITLGKTAFGKEFSNSELAAPAAITPKYSVNWFIRCLSCSEALCTILNRGAGLELLDVEQASHPFSGGLLMQGHACGMLWGTALNVGLRSRLKFEDETRAGAAALATMNKLVDEFQLVTGSANCRDIIGGPIITGKDRLRYVTNGKAMLCTKLSGKWGPRANELIDQELAAFDESSCSGSSANCAVETMKKCAPTLGIDVDPQIVSAFAGGLGLKGNVCGALSAGVFALGLKFYQGKNKPRDSMAKSALQEFGISDEFQDEAHKLRKAFFKKHGTVLCRDIISRDFSSAADHADYVAGGGCGEVIDTVAKLVMEG